MGKKSNEAPDDGAEPAAEDEPEAEEGHDPDAKIEVDPPEIGRCA
jgi:hypothetical protein